MGLQILRLASNRGGMGTSGKTLSVVFQVSGMQHYFIYA